MRLVDADYIVNMIDTDERYHTEDPIRIIANIYTKEVLEITPTVLAHENGEWEAFKVDGISQHDNLDCRYSICREAGGNPFFFNYRPKCGAYMGKM